MSRRVRVAVAGLCGVFVAVGALTLMAVPAGLVPSWPLVVVVVAVIVFGDAVSMDITVARDQQAAIVPGDFMVMVAVVQGVSPWLVAAAAVASVGARTWVSTGSVLKTVFSATLRFQDVGLISLLYWWVLGSESVGSPPWFAAVAVALVTTSSLSFWALQLVLWIVTGHVVNRFEVVPLAALSALHTLFIVTGVGLTIVLWQTERWSVALLATFAAGSVVLFVRLAAATQGALDLASVNRILGTPDRVSAAKISDAAVEALVGSLRTGSVAFEPVPGQELVPGLVPVRRSGLEGRARSVTWQRSLRAAVRVEASDEPVAELVLDAVPAHRSKHAESLLETVAAHTGLLLTRATLEDRLGELAGTDPVTGLANNIEFVGSFADEWQSSGDRGWVSPAVCSVSPSTFVSVRNQFGSEVAGEFMRVLAGRAGSRAGVVSLARLTDDVFVLRVDDDFDVSAFATDMSLPVPSQVGLLPTGTHVGLVPEQTASSPNDLAAVAVEAAAAAVLSGQRVFTLRERAGSVHRRRLEVAALLTAWSGSSSELELEYWPLMSLQFGSVAAAEVSFVWAGGLASESEIWDAAAVEGRAEHVFFALVAEVTAEVARSGFEGRVVLPTPASLLLADGFVERLAALAARVDLPTVEFRVGPAGVFDEVPASLESLRALGEVSLSGVDGFSSLALCRSSAVSCVYVAPEGVAAVAVADLERQAVAGLIAGVHALGVEVACLHVASPVVAHALETIGCDFASGPVWSAAVSLGDLGG